MIISNCASGGADSVANPVTGVVTRKDTTTGAVIAANIRPTSGEPVAAVTSAAEPAGLASGALGAVLAFSAV